MHRRTPRPLPAGPRRQRVVATAAGMLALLFYGLAPFAPAVPATADPVPICTAHGMVRLALPDTDGNRPPAGRPDCPACTLTMHGGGPAKAVLPAAVGPRLADAGGAPWLPPRAAASPAQSDGATAQPRGPPLSA